MQRYLKSDFYYHTLFDNKYAEQSYIAYLSKDNRKYIMNSSDFVDRYIVITINFIFRINNAICRRGLVSNNIEDIKNIYDNPINNEIYNYYGTSTISEIYHKIKVDNLTNQYELEIYDMLKTIISWEDKFENNYDEFKGVIYNLVKTIDDKHYTWIVGNSIIYNRSVSDNVNKSFYCILLGSKGYDIFKKTYYNKIYAMPKEKKILLEQVSDILIMIADIYNELINKNYDDAVDILKTYLEDNTNMEYCKDIYYAKTYMNLKSIFAKINSTSHTEIVNQFKDIINIENEKYKKYFALYENIAIDEKSIEQGQFIEL